MQDIPLVPIARHGGPPRLARGSPATARFGALFEAVALRAPAADDAARWRAHVLGGRLLHFAQPLTFTPYAAARPCSARCGFCSENLREDGGGTPAATLRPGPRYFDDLGRALAALDRLPLAYSLSGLEATDDPGWLLALLHTLRGASPGPTVEGTVLYTATRRWR